MFLCYLDLFVFDAKLSALCKGKNPEVLEHQINMFRLLYNPIKSMLILAHPSYFMYDICIIIYIDIIFDYISCTL